MNQTTYTYRELTPEDGVLRADDEIWGAIRVEGTTEGEPVKWGFAGANGLEGASILAWLNSNPGYHRARREVRVDIQPQPVFAAPILPSDRALALEIGHRVLESERNLDDQAIYQLVADYRFVCVREAVAERDRQIKDLRHQLQTPPRGIRRGKWG